MSDYNDIKLQMMKLWKDTFHDTDDYIKLVFDNYFNPKLVEYKVENGEVVAAMLGVPYCFDMKSDKVDSQEIGKLKGLYLCGLATKPECRKRGLMSDMIEKINQRVYQLDFDFSFLIPANDGLKKYYFDRGYVESFYRIKENYLPCHNFENEYYQRLMKSKNISITDINRKLDDFNNLKADTLKLRNENEVDGLVEYIKSAEENNPLLSIRHSNKDIKIAIVECLTSDGEIIFLKNGKSEVVAVAFIDFETDEEIQCLIKNYDSKESANYLGKGSVSYNHSHERIYSQSEAQNYPYDIKHKAINRNLVLNNIEGTDCPSFEKSNFENDEIQIDESVKSALLIKNAKAICEEEDNHSTSEFSRTCDEDISTSTNIKTVNIKAIFYNGMCEKYRLLEAVARRFGNAEQLTVVDSASHNNNSAIWRPMYIGEKSIVSPVGVVDNLDAPFNNSENAESHGMIRLLNPRKVLKFLCASLEEFKNSILAVDSVSQNEMEIITNVGIYLVNLPYAFANSTKINEIKEIHDCKNREELLSENCKSVKNDDSNRFLTFKEHNQDADGVSEVGIFPITHEEKSKNSRPVRISLQQLAEMLFSLPNEQKVVRDSLGIPSQQTFITLMLD